MGDKNRNTMWIGISGKKGVGKDTAGEILKECLESRVEIVRFSATLKEIASVLLGVPVYKFEEESFKASKLPVIWRRGPYGDITVRKLLQILGTEMSRAIHPDILVNIALENLEDSEMGKIITDVRFENEVKAVKKRGGVLIRIEREGVHQDGHSSETALDDFDDWDYKISNDGSLEDLREKLMNIKTYEKWT